MEDSPQNATLLYLESVGFLATFKRDNFFLLKTTRGLLYKMLHLNVAKNPTLSRNKSVAL